MDGNRATYFRGILIVATLVSVAGLVGAQTTAWNPQEWSRWNGYEISGFAVTGAPPELAKELQDGLRTRGQWKLLKGNQRPPFSAKELLEDLRRIRFFLAQAGYPASEVHPELVTDTRANTLSITFVVDPGPHVAVAEIIYEGWPEDIARPPADHEHLMQQGQAFTDQAFDEMLGFLRLWLHDAGFAEVDLRARPERVEGNSIRVTFEIVAGDFFKIGEVIITGCSDDLVPVARRVMNLPPGSDFSASRIVEAVADLRGTQLFSAVAIDTEVMGPGELRLTAQLTNARMRSWRASVGTFSDNPWMVRVGWTHRNLFKRSRGLDVHGTAATHLLSYGVSYYWLGWLSPRARSAYRVERIKEREDAYNSDEYRAEFVQSLRPRGRGLYTMGISLSNVTVETLSPDADDVPEEQGWLLETWIDRKWDWTNEPMYPTFGGYVKIALTAAPPGPKLETPYLKAQVDGANYLPLSGRFNFASRLRLGVSQPLGDSQDLIANRRFYAGGYNSMRGYERRQLGPRDASNNPRGGQAVALVGAELRIRMFGIFDSALFIDTGQVWRLVDEMNFADIEAAVGAALDLRSPLGPLRVGYAWNLTQPISGEPRGLWHFGIGYPW